MDIYDDISRLMNTYGSSRAPTHKENYEHFKRLLTCDDQSELNAYAASNIRMVANVVTKFLKRHRSAVYLVDDLFSTALCTMLSALRSLVKRAQDDPDEFWNAQTGLGRLDEEGRFPVSMYLYISLYRATQHCYEMDAVYAISKSNHKRFTPKGAKKPIHKVNFIKGGLSEIGDYDHFDIIYLWNDILDLCVTDFERSIIEMRLSMNDQKIAESLGCCQQWIQRTRQRVYKRFQQSLQKDQSS